MSRLFTGSIDVTKIIKDKLYTGKKGTYLNISVWLNDEPNEFGNIASIQQSTKRDEPKLFIGDLKEYKKAGGQDSGQDGGQVNTGLDETDDEMPF